MPAHRPWTSPGSSALAAARWRCRRADHAPCQALFARVAVARASRASVVPCMAETPTRHVCASSPISSVARRYRAASARLLPPNLCTWQSAEGSGTGRDAGIVELLVGLRAVIRERLPELGSGHV